MLKDYFAPELGWHRAAPQAVGRWARAAAQRATVPALVGGGVLIGLCPVPCRGALYLAVLALPPPPGGRAPPGPPAAGGGARPGTPPACPGGRSSRATPSSRTTSGTSASR